MKAKYLKLIITMLIVLTMISSVYAVCLDDIFSYWRFEENYNEYFDSQDFNKWLSSGTVNFDGNLDVTPVLGTRAELYSDSWKLRGDFDIEIYFENFNPAATDTTMLEFYVYNPNGNQKIRVERIRTSGSDNYYRWREYSTANSWQNGAYSTASNTYGKMRITRSGSTFSCYYWNGSSWTLLSAPSTTISNTDDLYVYISGYTANPSYTASFDNFLINSGTVVPGTLSDEKGFNSPINEGSAKINGKLGDGVDFDGVDDYITLGYIDFMSSQNYSISMWVNLDGSSRGTVIDRTGFSTSTYEINIGENDVYYGINDGSNNPNVNVTSTFNIGQWYHLVAVRDVDADKLKLYVDGNLLGEVTDTTISEISASGSSVLGRKNVSELPSGENYFDGQIDEVAIYNKALSSIDVKYIYEASDNKGLDYCDDFNPNVTGLNTVNYTGNLINATDLTIKEALSSIKWGDGLNILGEDLSGEITLSSNFVSVNAVALDASLNSTAEVNLTVDGCANLAIFYADTYETSFPGGSWISSPCLGGDCMATCTGTTATLTVTHFDGWAATGDGDIPAIPEFNLLGIIMISVMAGIALFLISRRS